MANTFKALPLRPPTVQVLTAGVSYTTPAGCTGIKVTVVGGGGAGGGAAATGAATAASGAGGGGGGAAIKFIQNPAATYAYAIGPGGTVGAAGNVAGNAGTNSSFNTTIIGNGGAGGNGGAAAGGLVAEQQNGGAGGSASGGDTNIPGAPGTIGLVLSTTTHTPGNGGSSALGFGSGASGVANSSQNGVTGASYGGGGSGGGGTNSVARTGGAGAPGIILVEEYY